MSVKLSPEIRYQIARKILIHFLAKEDRVFYKDWLNRELPNAAKEIGENPVVLRAFVEEILPEILALKLGCSQVTLVWAEKS